MKHARKRSFCFLRVFTCRCLTVGSNRGFDPTWPFCSHSTAQDASGSGATGAATQPEPQSSSITGAETVTGALGRGPEPEANPAAAAGAAASSRQDTAFAIQRLEEDSELADMAQCAQACCSCPRLKGHSSLTTSCTGSWRLCTAMLAANKANIARTRVY